MHALPIRRMDVGSGDAIDPNFFGHDLLRSYASHASWMTLRIIGPSAPARLAGGVAEHDHGGHERSATAHMHRELAARRICVLVDRGRSRQTADNTHVNHHCVALAAGAGVVHLRGAR